MSLIHASAVIAVVFLGNIAERGSVQPLRAQDINDIFAWKVYSGDGIVTQQISQGFKDIYQEILSGPSSLAQVDFVCDYAINAYNLPALDVLPLIGKHIELVYKIEGTIDLSMLREFMIYMPTNVSVIDILPNLRIEQAQLLDEIKREAMARPKLLYGSGKARQTFDNFNSWWFARE
jgi:hypothetical protein